MSLLSIDSLANFKSVGRFTVHSGGVDFFHSGNMEQAALKLTSVVRGDWQVMGRQAVSPDGVGRLFALVMALPDYLEAPEKLAGLPREEVEISAEAGQVVFVDPQQEINGVKPIGDLGVMFDSGISVLCQNEDWSGNVVIYRESGQKVVCVVLDTGYTPT